MKGEDAIVTDDLKKEIFDIFFNTETTFEKITSLLSKYNLYSNEQIILLKKFEKKASIIKDDVEFKDYIIKFQDELFNSSLNIFERNTLLFYTSALKTIYKPSIFNTVVFNTNVSNKTNSPCGTCIQRNGWRIFGWGFLFAVLVAIACLVAGPWVAIACLIVAFGTFILLFIKTYCCKVCSQIPC